MTFSDLIHAPVTYKIGLLLLALLLGGMVGWERERHERPAGLRTHILVCLASALITLVSDNTLNSSGRITAQIITGVGFLGAGTIIREGTGGIVRGLTTAASLWAMAGVGIGVGSGGQSAILATVATLIILVTLTVLNRLDNFLIHQRTKHELTVVFESERKDWQKLSRLMDALRHRKVKIRDLRLEKMADTEVAHFQITVSRSLGRDGVGEMLRHDTDILHYEWDN